MTWMIATTRSRRSISCFCSARFAISGGNYHSLKDVSESSRKFADLALRLRNAPSRADANERTSRKPQTTSLRRFAEGKKEPGHEKVDSSCDVGCGCVHNQCD